MAQVVKCDQCGKVDQPNNMKYAVLQIGKHNRHGIDDDSNNMADGDFCSQECVKLYIYAKLNDLWYTYKYT